MRWDGIQWCHIKLSTDGDSTTGTHLAQVQHTPGDRHLSMQDAEHMFLDRVWHISTPSQHAGTEDWLDRPHHHYTNEDVFLVPEVVKSALR